MTAGTTYASAGTCCYFVSPVDCGPFVTPVAIVACATVVAAAG